jgi:predicted CXXCH cytochrome family protein
MKRMLLAGLALVLVLAAMGYTVMNSPDPHAFSQGQCYSCHLEPDENPKALVASVSRLCRGCHARTVRVSSHPVNIVPKKAQVPADMPLRRGRLTCVTCHDIHSSSRLVFGVKSYFLRRPTTDMRFFCVACHEENTLRPGHKELLEVAHMGSKYRVLDPDSPIDPLSRECIGCHDGSIGPEASYTLGEGWWEHPRPEAGHPIGVDYLEAQLYPRSGLAPPYELDPRIKFFGGRIGCGTCHDMYSTLPGKLVMPNKGSRLCRECHYDK